MAVTKLLGLLLTLQFMMNTVSTAGINSRQLDIPAFKAFFSQIQSHLVNDKDKGSTGTGVKIEGLNPPPAVSPDVVNTTFVKSVNLVSRNESKFGVNVLRDSESSNWNAHRHQDGMMKGVFSSSLPVPQMVETKGLESDSDFRSPSSSSHGSFVFNNQRPAGSVISTKGNALDGKSEPLPFHSRQPAPTQPLQFHQNPSSNYPTAYSPQITANQETRTLPFQGSTNVHTAPVVTASSNDWIPISQPNGLPFSNSYTQSSTNRPDYPNGPILQDTASNFDPFTLIDGQSSEDNSDNKEKEKNTIGSTASDDANDVVDNHSDPSFLSGFRFKSPEIQEPLYGQVVAPPKNYSPARKPVPKHVYKAPYPLNINQIIAEAVDPIHSNKPPVPSSKPPVHSSKPPVHSSKPPMQPEYKASKLSIKGKLKPNLHSSYGLLGKNRGNGGGKDMHNMGNQFPYSPIKTGDPSFRTLFKGPIHDSHSPVQNNFDDGFRDGVGKVSSFSYFRNQGPDTPGSKGFDQAFNVHAGRNIANQFKQHMFDQTGFPGKIQ